MSSVRKPGSVHVDYILKEFPITLYIQLLLTSGYCKVLKGHTRKS